MFDLWWRIIGMLVLGTLSIFDIRTKKIPACGLFIVFIYSIIGLLCFGHNGFLWSDYMVSVIPGVVFIMLSVITENKIGVGDGILVMGLGLGIGLEQCLLLLTGALILNCAFCGVLLVIKKAGRNTRIPFVPFITIGMGVIFFAVG